MSNVEQNVNNLQENN